MKKRLLLVTNGFPFGESERSFLGEEVKQLSEAFDLTVLALDIGEKLLYPTDGIHRIERYRISSFRRSCSIGMLADVFQPSTFHEVFLCLKKGSKAAFSQIFKEIVYFRFKGWEAKKKIRQIVGEEHIDIVYSYWCTGAALAMVELKKEFPDLNVVTRFHGMDLYEERTSIGWQPFRKQITAGADGLCFACEYGRSYFAEHWGWDCADKMHLFYLGSTDRGAADFYTGDRLRIVSCCNLIPLKQVELIIEGLALLPQSLNVAWDIFGDGTEREKLEALAAEKFRSCPNITWKFHGFVPNADLTGQYRKLAPQLFITTSSTEGGAPVSIQEVFSMGIPAVGTPVGGIPDLIVDGQTGFLLPQQPKPEDVVAAVMSFAALSEEQKRHMSSAARRHWSEKFDAVKNASHFTEYLLKLVSQ